MAAEERWYFTKEQLGNTPSRKCGIDPDRELSYRQQAANFIQDMGQRLQVNQLCINTSIVYMHRFYMFHSFTKFHRNAISTCALFLAAKVEEQPRKLEHVIKVAHVCLHRDAPQLDTKSEAYLEQAQELVINENIMLQTLGFDVAIDHPHTHVVKCCQLVRASRDLAQTSYIMATNSLHLTTMCLQYKPTVVACVCIHLACKWANWEIPQSNEGKRWFWYVDPTVTEELLEELTAEFLRILDRCPSRLKRKVLSASVSMNDKNQDPLFDKKLFPNDNSNSANKMMSTFMDMASSTNSSLSISSKSERSERRHERVDYPSTSTATPSKSSAGGDSKIDGGSAEKSAAHNSRSERKERLRKEHANATTSSSSSHGSGSSVPSTPIAAGHASQLSTPIIAPTGPRSPAGMSVSAVNAAVTPTDSTSVPNSLDHSLSSSHSSDSPVSPRKTKSDSSGNRGITHKEYREYRERKKRERVEREKSSVSDPMPKSAKIESIDGERIKGLTIGNTPLSALNLQPVVSLTHLNLSNLAKMTTTKHSHSSTRQQQKTPEKSKAAAAAAAASSESGKIDVGHNQKGFVADEKPVPKFQDGNYSSFSHRNVGTKTSAVPLDAMATTTTTPTASSQTRMDFTPSPPPTEDKTDGDLALENLLLNCGVEPGGKPSPMTTTDQLASNRNPSSLLNSEHRRREKDEFGEPFRKNDVKESKERLIKHHKSKGAPPPSFSEAALDTAVGWQEQLPSAPTLPQHAMMLTSHPTGQQQQQPPSLRTSTFSVPVKTEMKPDASRTSFFSHVPPQTSLNSHPSLAISSSPEEKGRSTITQEKTRSVSPLPVSASQHLAAEKATTITIVPPHTREHQEVKAKPAGEPPVAAATIQPQLTPHAKPTVPLLQPPQVSSPQLASGDKAQPTVTQPTAVATTPSAPPPHSSKHERREKHRHKDRDREKDKERSHDKKDDPPSIKLTIAKERIKDSLNASVTINSSGGNSDGSASKPPQETSGGGLKIKIVKEKTGNSSKLKMTNSVPTTSPATVTVNKHAAVKEGGGGSGLKMIIKMDRSKAACNLVETSPELRDKPERESRKREKDPSPRSAPVYNFNQHDEAPTDEPTPAKVPKLSSRSSKRNMDSGPPPFPPPPVSAPMPPAWDNNAMYAVASNNSGPPMDVPPSSNTRSSRHDHPGRHSNSDRHSGPPPPHPRGRGHKGARGHSGGRGRGGRGGGGNAVPMPPYGHQMNSGPYPYNPPFFNPYHQQPPPPNVPPSFFNRPPPPNDYQFYNQFGMPHGPQHMAPQPQPGANIYQQPMPTMMVPHQRSVPPLPREPPPAIPPPPPE